VRKVNSVVDGAALFAMALLIVVGPVNAEDRPHGKGDARHDAKDCEKDKEKSKDCEELTGPFTSSVGLPCSSPVGLCTHGTLQGDLSAQYDFTFETLTSAQDPLDPYKQFYTGTSIITTKDGKLVTHDTGVIHMLPDNQPAPFVTTATVVDGTGKYAKRRGEFVATGTLTFGNATGSYVAELCKEKKSK
jgi:hypothetical protein